MGSTQTAVGITGASGLIGRSLAIALAENGTPVIAWTRAPDSLHSTLPLHLRQLITCIPYQLGEMLRVPGSLQVDTIVHAAADLSSLPLSSRDQNNISGARSLLSDSRAGEIKRWIFLSSFSAHAEALSHYGRSKFEIEKLFLAHPNGLIVRPGLVLGRTGVYAKISRALRGIPIAPLFWHGKQPVQTIPLETLVSALIKLVQARELPFREWNLAHPTPLTLAEFYREIGNALGRKIRFLRLPGDLVLAALRFFGQLGIAPTLGSEQLLGLKASRVWLTQPSLAALNVDMPSLGEWLRSQNQGSLPRIPVTHSDT